MSTAKAGRRPGARLVLAIVAVIDLVLLYGVTLMYAQGELAFALLVLILAAVGSWVFVSRQRVQLPICLPQPARSHHFYCLSAYLHGECRFYQLQLQSLALPGACPGYSSGKNPAYRR